MTAINLDDFKEFYDIRPDGTITDKISGAVIPKEDRKGHIVVKLQRSDGTWFRGHLKDLLILLDSTKRIPLTVSQGILKNQQLQVWFYDNQKDHVTTENLYYTTRANLKKRQALEETGDLYNPIYTMEPDSGWKLKWESLMQFAKGSGSDPYDIWNQAMNEGTFQGLVLSFDEGFPKWTARMKARLRELQKKFEKVSDESAD